jgi:hypothetical protein
MVMDSRIPKVLGICSDSDELYEYVNEAQERLLQKGTWWGTIQRARFCVTQGCLTWPREVAAIRAIAVCTDGIPMRNAWYEFTGASWIRDDDDCGPLEMVDRGTSCVFSDINNYGNPKKLRFYPTRAADVGKRILVQGYDANSMWIRNQDGTVWVDGEYVTLGSPFSDTVSTFQSITGVQKDEMVDRVDVYELDTVLGTERQIAFWQATEIVPEYRRSFIPDVTRCSCSSDCDYVTVTALCKLKHVPIAAPTDYLIVGNLPAIKDMAMSIQRRENNEEQLALALEKSALRELVREKREMVGDITSIWIETQGTAPLSNTFAGMI